jgi:hypothetical protein
MPVIRKPKKYQEGGRVRAGNPGQTAARRIAEDYRRSDISDRVSDPAEIPEVVVTARRPPRRRARSTATDNSADMLNERVLRLTRGGAPQDETDRRLATAMGLAFKRGGLVRAKAKKK